MMAFRFSRLFWLRPLASLKTSPDRLRFVPLFLKLFTSVSLCSFFLEICPTIVRGCFWWFLISRLGVESFVLFLGLGRLFLFFVFSGSKSCEVLGLARLGFCIFFNFLFPCLALHISMGPSRSSILRIGSNPTEVFGSGRTGGESDSLAVVVHQAAPGNLLSPWARARAK